MSLRLLIFPALCLAFNQASAAHKTHCRSDELIFFSCSVRSKLISLCASPSTESLQYLEYRYGKPGRVEFIYRGTSKDVPRRFSRADINGATNSGTSVWFQNKGTDYVINDPAKGNPSLGVFTKGKRVSTLTCRRSAGDIKSDLDKPSDVIATKTEQQFFVEVLNLPYQ